MFIGMGIYNIMLNGISLINIVFIMYVYILIVLFCSCCMFFIGLSDCFEFFIWEIMEEGVLMLYFRFVEVFFFL